MDVLAAPSETGLTGWIIDLTETLGGPGAGLAVFAENLFPPIPSEVILPLAGFTASQGSMNLFTAVLWTTLGSVLGALLFYSIGALLGRERTRAIAGKIPLVKLDDIDRTEAWFARHGGKAVFLGRLVPVFRTFVSLPAGVERMRLPLFLGYTAAGSLLWNFALIFAGYQLGENWSVVERYTGVLQKVVLVVVVAAVAWFVGSRLLRTRRDRRRAEQETVRIDLAEAETTRIQRVDGAPRR